MSMKMMLVPTVDLICDSVRKLCAAGPDKPKDRRLSEPVLTPRRYMIPHLM